jgi:FkbM family methyltransferase
MTPAAPFFRRLLERASQRLVFRRRFPAAHGGAQLWVSPGAALGYYRSLDHPIFADLLRLASDHVHPGMQVWDIGANAGVFAFAAAHRAGATGGVLAIEADPWLCSLLQRSCGEQPTSHAPTQVLCAAISAEVGLERFEITARSRAGSHLASVSGEAEELVGQPSAQFEVVTLSLDWLLARQPPPQLVKIDVEGAESKVLQGADRLLREIRPVIMIETRDSQADAVTALLHRHRYELYDFSKHGASATPIDRTRFNTLAAPLP